MFSTAAFRSCGVLMDAEEEVVDDAEVVVVPVDVVDDSPESADGWLADDGAAVLLSRSGGEPG